MEDNSPAVMSLQARRLSLRNSRISPLTFTSTTSNASTSPPPLADETEWESEAESMHQPSPRRARTLDPSHLCAPTTHHKRGRSSDGSAKYIEYLERQAAELTAQLAGAGAAAKGRKAVVTENRNLRLELAEWEERFEVRVKDETDRRRKIDEALRGAVEELLAKLEECEIELRGAQAEAARARAREKELCGVEDENRRLCGRVEILTELLADSTGSQGRKSVVGSPVARVPRRISSLPGLRNVAKQEVETDTESRRVSNESGSFRGAEDYGITDMDAPLSPTISTSSSPSYHRRLSFGGSPPTSPSPRTRRMRRFPPGSTAPKTLILPSAAVMDSPTFSPSRKHFCSSAHSSNRPSLDLSGHSFSYPNPHRNSLFAELAAAGTDSDDESESETESVTEAPPATTATAPSSTTEVSPSKPDPSPEPEPAMYFEAPTEPGSPVVSPEDYAFSLVADEIRHPTPLLSKVLNHVPSPTSTFVSAKRKAIDMMLGHSAAPIAAAPVAAAPTLTTRRSHQLVPSLSIQRTRRTPSTSRKIPFIPPPTCCHECGAPRGRRKGAVGGMRKRSGSVVQPTGEDGMDVIWLWVRFIIAVVVALGVAVKDGSSPPPPLPARKVGGMPGMGMGEDDEGIDHVREEERSRALKKLEGKR